MASMPDGGAYESRWDGDALGKLETWSSKNTRKHNRSQNSIDKLQTIVFRGCVRSLAGQSQHTSAIKAKRGALCWQKGEFAPKQTHQISFHSKRLASRKPYV